MELQKCRFVLLRLLLAASTNSAMGARSLQNNEGTAPPGPVEYGDFVDSVRDKAENPEPSSSDGVFAKLEEAMDSWTILSAIILAVAMSCVLGCVVYFVRIRQARRRLAAAGSTSSPQKPSNNKGSIHSSTDHSDEEMGLPKMIQVDLNDDVDSSIHPRTILPETDSLVVVIQRAMAQGKDEQQDDTVEDEDDDNSCEMITYGSLRDPTGTKSGRSRMNNKYMKNYEVPVRQCYNVSGRLRRQVDESSIVRNMKKAVAGLAGMPSADAVEL